MVCSQAGSEMVRALGARTVCVTGATGFIGFHVLPLLQASGVKVRVLSRSAQTRLVDEDSVLGDLYDPPSLVRFLQGAEVLINLAQPSDALSDERFSQGISNLAQAALEAGVGRVLHISTAMVIGVPTAERVTEQTLGQPKTAYERQKFAAEQILRNELGAEVDFGILRPTAVFGVGGRNLLKLAGDVAHGSALKRRVLRFLHGKRTLHLVSVQEVAAAVVFLAFLPRPLDGQVFLVAADDEPTNNYQAVDGILAAAMGKPVLSASLRLPGAVLKFLLRVVGRSQADPRLIYDATKLRNWGFAPAVDFNLALREFAEAYMKNGGR